MRKSPIKIAAAIMGGLLALNAQAQTDTATSRVLTEDQIQTYWIYAQERLNKGDLRTAAATLYFLLNADGLTEEMLEQADHALLQITNPEAAARKTQTAKDSRPERPAPQPPTVTLEEVTTVVTDSPVNTPIANPTPTPATVIIEETATDQTKPPVSQLSPATIEQQDSTTTNGPALTAENPPPQPPTVTLDEVSTTTINPPDNTPVPQPAPTAVTENVAPTQIEQTVNDESEQSLSQSTQETTPAEKIMSKETPQATPTAADRRPELLAEPPDSTTPETTPDETTADTQTNENTEVQIELSLSADTSNNKFTEATNNRARDSTSELTVSIDHRFTPLLSGYLDVSLPLADSESSVDANEIYLYRDITTEYFSGELAVGTQSISESRGWMWDSTLDLIKSDLSINNRSLELGVGAETQNNFWADLFEPTAETNYRWIGALTQQINETNRLSLFATGVNDNGTAEDNVTSTISWLGARASGNLWENQPTTLDYWADLALVSGDETTFETIEDATGITTQQLLNDTKVRGWAYDLGTTWSTDLPGQPQFTVAIAGTSGDSNLDDNTDKQFRQSGLHSNSTDIGSATDVSSYGLVLDPELSNLRIQTLGVAFPLKTASFLSFMYHKYDQVTATDELRDAAIDLTLNGNFKQIGHGLDIVFGYEESDVWSVTLSAGFFTAGKATEQSNASAYSGSIDFSYLF